MHRRLTSLDEGFVLIKGPGMAGHTTVIGFPSIISSFTN